MGRWRHVSKATCPLYLSRSRARKQGTWGPCVDEDRHTPTWLHSPLVLTRRRRRRRREQEVQKLTQENEELRKRAEAKAKDADVPVAMVQPIKAGPRLVSQAAAAASAAEAAKRLARASSLAVGPAVLRRATTLPF